MRNFTNLSIWTKSKPWLVLGKGPSFDKVVNYNLDDYNVLCLNEACNYVNKSPDESAFWTVLIDLDVLDRVRAYAEMPVILMPYFPHVRYQPWPGTQFLEKNYRGIYRFGHSKWTQRQPKPIIKVKYNVAEAAFGILAYMGIKTIYSLGVDGGKEYAKAFNDFSPLGNGNLNFDAQIVQIQSTCTANGIKWIRL